MVYMTAQPPFSGEEAHSRIVGPVTDLRQFCPFFVCMLRLTVEPVAFSEVPDDFNLETSDRSILLCLCFSLNQTVNRFTVHRAGALPTAIEGEHAGMSN